LTLDDHKGAQCTKVYQSHCEQRFSFKDKDESFSEMVTDRA